MGILRILTCSSQIVRVFGPIRAPHHLLSTAYCMHSSGLVRWYDDVTLVSDKAIKLYHKPVWLSQNDASSEIHAGYTHPLLGMNGFCYQSRPVCWYMPPFSSLWLPWASLCCPGLFGSLLHMPAEATGDIHNGMRTTSTTGRTHYYTFIVWAVYGQEK